MLKAVAFDLDGVIYEGDHAIQGASDTIRLLKKKGLEMFFITNNSAKKRSSLSAKLTQLGIEAEVGNIMTSGYATFIFLKQLLKNKKARILVIGSKELEEELTQLDFEIAVEGPVDILVVGLDLNLNYNTIKRGLNALHHGALFVACNQDRHFPIGDGLISPACGSIVAALSWACGRKPDHVVGKPNTIMLELLARFRGFKPKEILVVGDTMESDIAMASEFGCESVLIIKPETIFCFKEGIRPNYQTKNVKGLLSIIEENYNL
jgi:4-nitrophenyl phosphatase